MQSLALVLTHIVTIFSPSFNASLSSPLALFNGMLENPERSGTERNGTEPEVVNYAVES